MPGYLQYVFFGALIFQVLFMFILYLQDRKKVYYIYYSLYVLGIFLGTEPKLFFGLRNAFVFIIERPTVLAYFLFLDSFLDISGHSPRFRRFMKYLTPAIGILFLEQCVVTMASEFYGPAQWLTRSVNFSDDLFFYLTYIASFYTMYETYRLKNTLSRYILAGTFFLVFGIIVNRIFYETLYDFPLMLGTSLELLFFSAAIGYKTNLIESEKRRAQEQLMHNTLIALRDQMKPHFIANCLNSIKLLIQREKNKKAIDYLTQFSKLHRQIVEHFQDLKISIKKELEVCQSYLEMEKLRFKETLNYTFDIRADENLLSFVELPPLLFQPIVENAIWHGLLQKEGDKQLIIRVEDLGNCMQCTVEDNGVGRSAAEPSGALMKPSGFKKKAGLANTLEKIKVFSQLYAVKIKMDFVDKFNAEGRPAGLKVIFTIFYE